MVVIRLALLIALVGVIAALVFDVGAQRESKPERREKFALRAAMAAAIAAALLSAAIASEASDWRPIGVTLGAGAIGAIALYGALSSLGRARAMLAGFATVFLALVAFLGILSVGFLFLPAMIAAAVAAVLGLRRSRPDGEVWPPA